MYLSGSIMHDSSTSLTISPVAGTLLRDYECIHNRAADRLDDPIPSFVHQNTQPDAAATDPRLLKIRERSITCDLNGLVNPESQYGRPFATT